MKIYKSAEIAVAVSKYFRMCMFLDYISYCRCSTLLHMLQRGMSVCLSVLLLGHAASVKCTTTRPIKSWSVCLLLLVITNNPLDSLATYLLIQPVNSTELVAASENGEYWQVRSEILMPV